jgi:serine/threonine protein kinase
MQAGLATGPTGHDTVFAPLASDPLAPAEIAKHFPQLEILAELGRGGMGVVYKARQIQLDRVVALKVLPPDAARDPNFAERFLREARALAKLNHPNIVAVYEFGVTGRGDVHVAPSPPAGGVDAAAPSYFYLIMEFVDGANLRQLEHSHRLTPAEALAIIPKICDALQYAHEEGVVHRDIKPENILMDKRGRVKIADFGLAKLLGQTAADARLTRSNLQMGTPHYMAPEQMEKPLSVDHRADIYSLGVVFYELLTGELPLGRFAPPSQKVQVDVRLDEIVLRSMEHDVERRYQHVSEVKTDVENLTQSGPPPAASKPPPRSKLFVGTAATVVLLLAAGWFAFGHRFFGKPWLAGTAAPVVATAENHFNCATNNGTITITKYTGPGGAVTIPSTINGLRVTVIGDDAFKGCTNLASLMFSSNVTSIGHDALAGCSGLTNLTIPASVTSITGNPFPSCSGLISISVDAANPAYSSADGVVFNKDKTCLVIYPGGKAGSFVIPDGVGRVGECAFNSCQKLTSVMTPFSATRIEGFAFWCCANLTKVTIGNSVTHIEEGAFGHCSGLTSLTIPESVTNVGPMVFRDCSNLSAIYFKGNAPKLGQTVFNGSNKATIYYQPGTTGWGPEFGGRPTAPWNPQAK